MKHRLAMAPWGPSSRSEISSSYDCVTDERTVGLLGVSSQTVRAPGKFLVEGDGFAPAYAPTSVPPLITGLGFGTATVTGVSRVVELGGSRYWDAVHHSNLKHFLADMRLYPATVSRPPKGLMDGLKALMGKILTEVPYIAVLKMDAHSDSITDTWDKCSVKIAAANGRNVEVVKAVTAQHRHADGGGGSGIAQAC